MGGGIRTPDRRFRKPMLYPTELRPHVNHIQCFMILSKFNNLVIKKCQAPNKRTYFRLTSTISKLHID